MHLTRRKDSHRQILSHLPNQGPLHIQISDYSIYQTIGLGGFAKVKRAIHNPTGEQVAVKIIPLLKLSKEQLNDLEREIQIHKQLSHSNISKIYQVYRDTNKVYIFIEYCENGELYSLIRNQGPLQIDFFIKIFKQIFSAIQYLHQNGIAHRDIKTENILLTKEYDAKLIDFGMATHVQSSSQQMLTTFCGSPCYLSPEMIVKKSYDGKLVDIWCFGVTLYVMLMAKLPFYDQQLSCLRASITSLNYTKILIPKIGQLIDKMLTFADERISLKRIRQSDFFRYSKSQETHCLSPTEQLLAIDEIILDKIKEDYGICQEDIRSSLNNLSLDKNYAIYFITLQKSRKNGYLSCYNVNCSNFMKKRHSSTDIRQKKNYKSNASLPKKSMIILNPITSRMLDKKVKMNNNLRKISNAEEKNIGKIRRKQSESPESPKRILDYTKGYLQSNQLSSIPLKQLK